MWLVTIKYVNVSSCVVFATEMTKLLRTKNNKIPEIGYFSGVPGRIRNSSDNSGMGCITESAEKHQMLT